MGFFKEFSFMTYWIFSCFSFNMAPLESNSLWQDCLQHARFWRNEVKPEGLLYNFLETFSDKKELRRAFELFPNRQWSSGWLRGRDLHPGAGQRSRRLHQSATDADARHAPDAHRRRRRREARRHFGAVALADESHSEQRRTGQAHLGALPLLRAPKGPNIEW